MKQIVKVSTTIMAVLMALTAFISCAQTPVDETTVAETTAVIPQATSGAEETTELVVNALNILGPKELNTTVTIYTNKYDGMWSSDLFYPENDGDVLGSAIYMRNATISEQFKVTINEKAHGSRIFTTSLKPIIEANDTEVCQALCMTLADAANSTASGYLQNIKAIDNIDLTGQWWNQANNASWSIKGRQFFATGDITTTDDMSIRTLYFNKTILKDINYDLPYQIVKDGKWTFEKFFEYVNAAAVDVGNNGMSKNEDTFGLSAQNTLGFMLLSGAGEVIASKDNNDVPYITTVSEVDRFVEITTYLTSKISSNTAIFTGGDADETGIFQQGRALFNAEVLSHVKTLRQNYDINFGLLPMPKYNEDQDTYYQYSEGFCSVVIAFPSITKGEELDASSFVIEAMAIESVNSVTPAFYELCLKGRYTSDYESTEMLDIITANVLTDFGDIYGWGGLKSAVKTAIINGESIVSVLKGTSKVAQKACDNTIKAIDSFCK